MIENDLLDSLREAINILKEQEKDNVQLGDVLFRLEEVKDRLEAKNKKENGESGESK